MGLTRAQVATHTKFLSRDYSEGSKGYCNKKELKHVAAIPKILMVTDPDLLLMQKAELYGDNKEAKRLLAKFLQRHPECSIKVTK